MQRTQLVQSRVAECHGSLRKIGRAARPRPRLDSILLHARGMPEHVSCMSTFASAVLFGYRDMGGSEEGRSGL